MLIHNYIMLKNIIPFVTINVISIERFLFYPFLKCRFFSIPVI